MYRGEDRSLTDSLLFDSRVEWAEQQFDKVILVGRVIKSAFMFFQVRVKRGVGLLRVGESIPEELVELWKEEEQLDRLYLLYLHHTCSLNNAQAKQATNPR